MQLEINMAAPMVPPTKGIPHLLLQVIGTVLFVGALSAVVDEIEDILLCRKCGTEVSKASEIMTVASKLAHRQRNDTLAGSRHVLIQLFKNPQDQYFEVIASKSASVQAVGQRYSTDSWFPGFDWTIVVCPRCGSHLGWLFQAIHKHSQHSPVSSFYGLVLNNLLHTKEAESIIAVPKVYRS